MQPGTASAATATTTTGAAAKVFSYQGDAYGTQVNVGSVLRSGQSALVTLGCATTAGIRRTNTAAGINLSPILATGTLNTTADTFASPTQTKTSATVQSANLLAGLVRATAVRSVSATTRTAASFATSAAGTTFTQLVIAGHKIAATVGPNTKVSIAGYGYVVLNEQAKVIGTTSAYLTVNAIHVVINTVNPLRLAVGTNIVVAHATSSLTGAIVGTLDGVAYGSSPRLGTVVRSGPSFSAGMPCTGTNGVLRANTGAAVNVLGVLTSATIRDTVRGTVTVTAASGESTSSVASATLLGALVRASLVKADAHASKTGTVLAFTATGSSFGSLSVTGFPRINASVAANTQLTIAGVGTLYLRRVIRTPNSIEVRMIELIVTHNLPGILAGSDIRVALAEASAH